MSNELTPFAVAWQRPWSSKLTDDEKRQLTSEIMTLRDAATRPWLKAAENSARVDEERRARAREDWEAIPEYMRAEGWGGNGP